MRWPGFSLVAAAKGGKAVGLLESESPDIAFVDLDSLGGDSFNLLSKIRRFSQVPIVIFSESNDVMDKIRALEMGADDWISKSFIPLELLAKVKAVLRRCGITDF